MSDNTKTFLIFGASSAIAKAVVEQLSVNPNNQVITFSRTQLDWNKPNITHHAVSDYEQAALDSVIQSLDINQINLTGLYIFNGILHSQQFRPEKALSQFDPLTFEKVIKANTTTPILIIQTILKAINKDQSFKVAALSARIGSLSDNGLGGWHSYRASKAALNMLLKNITIECARSYKGLKFISYHPGTTDSPLSKPFQANVPSEQLFSSEQSAKYFLTVVENQRFDQELSYVDWQGKTIPW